MIISKIPIFITVRGNTKEVFETNKESLKFSYLFIKNMNLFSQTYIISDNKKMLESYEIYLKDNQLNSYLAYQISTYYLETGEIELAKAYIDSGLNADDEYRDKLLFNDVVYYEKILDFNSALGNAQALKEAYPDVEEYQKEYDFLYTRVNIDTTLSNGTTPEEGN